MWEVKKKPEEYRCLRCSVCGSDIWRMPRAKNWRHCLGCLANLRLRASGLTVALTNNERHPPSRDVDRERGRIAKERRLHEVDSANEALVVREVLVCVVSSAGELHDVHMGQLPVGVELVVDVVHDGEVRHSSNRVRVTRDARERAAARYGVSDKATIRSGQH